MKCFLEIKNYNYCFMEPATKKARKTTQKHWAPVPQSCKLKQAPKQLWSLPSNAVLPRFIEMTITLSPGAVQDLKDSTPGMSKLHNLRFCDLSCLGSMPMEPTLAGVCLSEPSRNYWQLHGKWILTRNNHWKYKPTAVQPNWSFCVNSVMSQRCRAFGKDISACIHGFMVYMHYFAQQSVNISMMDLMYVGAPVLLDSMSKPVLLCDNALDNSEPWYRSSIDNAKPFSMTIRDGYIVHPHKDTLETVVLPLVINMQPELGHRQLIIVDTIPNLSSMSGTSPMETPVIVMIHSLDELKCHAIPSKTEANLRHQLKAPYVRVYISASAVSNLMDLLAPVANISDPCMVTHKHTRKALKLITILADLPWDRVITCCACPVRLQPGHKIKFWWTLCQKSGDPCNQDAPLSQLTSRSRFTERIKLLLNRHRMIDLSCVPVSYI